MDLLGCRGVLHLVVWFLTLPSAMGAGNEDNDHLKNSKQMKTHEGPHGIPASIDNMLEQIAINFADDQSLNKATQNKDENCMAGSSISELDMCLTPQQAALFDPLVPHYPLSSAPSTPAGRKKRQASANGFSLWKNGVIPYVFNTTFPAKDRNSILSAMSEWEKATCVRFRPANPEDRDVVVFRDGRRCSTNIGRIGREQAITLAKTCRSKRILIHELGHVIGLIHEHQRHDRDKYVKVLMANVRTMSQERYQFSKLLSGPITDKAVKYDYTSVMHYGRNYFSRRSDLTTLQTVDSRYQDVIGRAVKPSFRDVETVSRLYQCSAGCPRNQRCGESCFMDSICVCRCPTGVDKAIFNDPGQLRNNLPDATCEFFASRGECFGNIKDTVRPLCARSCSLYQSKSNRGAQDSWTAGANRLQAKAAHRSSWSLPSPTPGGSVRSRGLARSSNAVSTASTARSGNTGNLARSVNPGSPVRNGNTSPNDVRVDSVVPLQNQRPSASAAPIRSNYQPLPPPEYSPMREPQVQTQQVAPSQAAADNLIVIPSPTLTPLQNFRAALLQRQKALISSEPQQPRWNRNKLVLSRSTNGRTARLTFPSQYQNQNNRNSYQRARFSPRMNYVQARDRTPQRRNFTSFSGISSWLGISRNQPYSRQAAPTVQPQTPRPRLSRNRPSGYDRSGVNAASIQGLSNQVGSNWRRDNNNNENNENINVYSNIPTLNRIHNIQQNKRNFGLSVRGLNLPLTIEVERVEGPMPLEHFGGPEYGNTESRPTQTKVVEHETALDAAQTLQRTGPSFMKSEIGPSRFLEQTRTFGVPVERSQVSRWVQHQKQRSQQTRNQMFQERNIRNQNTLQNQHNFMQRQNIQHGARTNSVPHAFESSISQVDRRTQRRGHWDSSNSPDPSAGHSPSGHQPGDPLQGTSDPYNAPYGHPVDQLAFSDSAPYGNTDVPSSQSDSTNIKSIYSNNNNNNNNNNRQSQTHNNEPASPYHNVNFGRAFTDPNAGGLLKDLANIHLPQRNKPVKTKLFTLSGLSPPARRGFISGSPEYSNVRNTWNARNKPAVLLMSPAAAIQVPPYFRTDNLTPGAPSFL